jgi:hypothetical protein
MDAIAPYAGFVTVRREPREPMARMRSKSDLPVKDCVACGRPFTWRKKWERDWENVKHCSDACRSGARSRAQLRERPKGAQ